MYLLDSGARETRVNPIISRDQFPRDCKQATAVRALSSYVDWTDPLLEPHAEASQELAPGVCIRFEFRLRVGPWNPTRLGLPGGAPGSTPSPRPPLQPLRARGFLRYCRQRHPAAHLGTVATARRKGGGFRARSGGESPALFPIRWVGWKPPQAVGGGLLPVEDGRRHTSQLGPPPLLLLP